MQKEELTIERRIRAIEDRLEIYNLIAGHPPSADTGSAAYAEAVFTADAVFDRGPGLSGDRQFVRMLAGRIVARTGRRSNDSRPLR